MAWLGGERGPANAAGLSKDRARNGERQRGMDRMGVVLSRIEG